VDVDDVVALPCLGDSECPTDRKCVVARPDLVGLPSLVEEIQGKCLRVPQH
jgi:hypothetical protein